MNERKKRILVGVDGSDNGRHALLWAIDQARDLRAEIVAVHAIELPPHLFVVTVDGVEDTHHDRDHQGDEPGSARKLRSGNDQTHDSCRNPSQTVDKSLEPPAGGL